jgi:hypothetical protein
MADKSPASGKVSDNTRQTAPALFDSEQYEKHKRSIAVVLGRYMLQHLLALYREFEGDLLIPIILGEIAHHNVNKFYYWEGMCLKPRSDIPPEAERLQHLDSTNAYSISESTGIPRETVRRKIEKMVGKGWLTKGARGELSITELAVNHFTGDFNKQMITELLASSACIEDLLHTD